MYADLSLRAYLEKTSAGEAVPGGGSVSALAGALGSVLAGMVAGLTAGRKEFESVEKEMQETAANAANLMERCLKLVDRDPEAYRKVMAAFKLPRQTDSEKADRRRAVQVAMETAARVPLEVAELALEILELTDRVVRRGNPNAVTDGAVGALMARSAGLGAIYNVRINLKSLKDPDLVATLASRADALEAQILQIEKKVLAAVQI
ncbi:MAG TPA: cyclodeaminase/cyclohydrolase family protein [Desulfobacterales bacterium]